MSTSRRRRTDVLRDLAMAGRELSDAAVLFHTALADRLGLNVTDWKVLGLLERHGPLTAGELAARTGLAPPSVTGIVDRLERKGWLRRSRDSADARRVIVALDERAVAQDVGERFAGLTRRLDELYRRYSVEELELVLDALTEIARRQREATTELTEG